MALSSPPKAHPPGFCSGCETQFTIAGLPRHLSQTQKPKCIAFRQAQEMLLTSENVQGVPPPSPVSFDDVDMDAFPIPFEGDFYGDYAPDFFDGDGAPTPPGSDSDSDPDSDSDSDDDEPEVQSWEPPPRVDTLANTEGASGSNVDTSVPLTSASAAGRAEERRAIEAKAARKTFVVRYPSKLAGAPISKAKSVTSTNDSYRSQLNPANADDNNPYAPFASKLDWEIARWAKLRGPGSTAFTDLLAIEEVSRASCVCASPS